MQIITLLQILALLYRPCIAALSPHKDHAVLHHVRDKVAPVHRTQVLASVPLHEHGDKCFKGPHKSLMAADQVKTIMSNGKDAVPGAGTESEQKPFEKVYKDGFFEAACVKDYMFDKGDKFGMNKGTYAVEDNMNVSIVLYKSHVSPPEPMSRKICFDFCRTIPDMKFFGLVHGRDCYCSPFFKQDPGDSSGCDAVCEGKPTEMCGGMAKSNIFAMHLCANTAEEISDAIEKADELVKAAAGVGEEGVTTSKELEEAATDLMNKFGAAGDPVASGLMKTAIKFTGDFERKAKKTVKLGEKLEKLKGEAEGFEGKDMTDFETVQKAETTIADIDKTSEDLEVAMDGTIASFGKVMGEKIALEHNVKEEKLELKEEEEEGPPEDEGPPEEGEEKEEPPSPLKLFLPVMHFVDQDASGMPSTCGGDLLGNPLALNAEDCAMSCQIEGNKCSGFSFFHTETTGLCFLFAKMKSVTYYTECGKFLQMGQTSNLFLQLPPTAKKAKLQGAKAKKLAKTDDTAKVPSPFALAMRKKRDSHKQKRLEKAISKKKTTSKTTSTVKRAPEDTMCYAKYSMFSGTTLKPDPSGKCKNCLKTVDKAQRCFE